METRANEEIKKIIMTELPRLMKSDPDIRTFILDATRERYADKTETERRIDRILDELKEDREARDKKWGGDQGRLSGATATATMIILGTIGTRTEKLEQEIVLFSGRNCNFDGAFVLCPKLRASTLRTSKSIALGNSIMAAMTASDLR